jgi:hypothetical protein
VPNFKPPSIVLRRDRHTDASVAGTLLGDSFLQQVFGSEQLGAWP